MSQSPVPPEGLLLVDKPAGITSHDVVARVRKLAGTRRVGHAGTLDPLATGLLILGLGRATRLLGHLTLHDKDYEALIRLGEETSTDDREGEVVRRAAAGHLTEADVRSAAASLTGALSQVPPAVSAIKIDGRRAYARVRAGEEVVMQPREVTVDAFEVLSVEPDADGLQVAAHITCSTGTYIRSLARDLGVGLGSAGHLLELRRTRIGGYAVSSASTLENLQEGLPVLPLAAAAAAAFPTLHVDAAAARQLGHGIGISLPDGVAQAEPTAVLGPAGELIALVRHSDGRAQPLAVFQPS